ncbi:MAG: carbohydrate kinase family protein [Halanaerobiaceae bacterium]
MAVKSKIVVIGGANIDIKGYSANTFQPGSSNSGIIKESSGGVARNVAANLGYLGCQLKLLTAIGSDYRGEKLLADTGKSGVNLEYIKRMDDHATGTYLAVIDADGELVGAINSMEIINGIDTDYLKDNLNVLDSADWIFIDTNLNKGVITWLLNKSFSGKIIIDPVSIEKSSKIKAELENIDILTPNLIEFCYLYDIDFSELDLLISEQDISELLRLIASNRNKKSPGTELIITLGAEGVIYSGPGQNFWEPAVDLNDKIIESTGAGDALSAGIIYGLSRLKSIREAIKIGQEMAGLNILADETVRADSFKKLKERGVL